MALLNNIDYSPSEDTMQDVFDKVNAAIDTINSVLGGYTEGQALRKLSGNDFDFTTFEIGNINFKTLDIGVWNMLSTSTVNVSHGITDALNNIISVSAVVINDAETTLYDFTYGRVTGLTVWSPSGRITINSDDIVLERDDNANGFYNNNFDSTGINRGRLIIVYKS